jgi:hypothetical protein
MAVGYSTTESAAVGSSTGNGIDSQHPQYECRKWQWQRCRDTWAGQDAVKQREGGRCYLPPTEGMILDGCNGQDPRAIGVYNYNAYLTRALFHGFVSDAVDMAMGLMWNKCPVFEGIKGPIEYLLTKATSEGESLERLLYRVNEQQIGIGRLGLLADMPKGETVGKAEPYITLYHTEACINWDAGFRGELASEALNMVVLDESGPKRINTFQWDCCDQYRVLMLGPSDTNEQQGAYRYGVFSEDLLGGTSGVMFDEDQMAPATIHGKTLDEIPFVFINANSTTSKPCDPPLMTLVDLCLALYRLSADYRQELHMSTVSTVVTKGMAEAADPKKPLRIGPGGHIDLGGSPTADAFYLEVSGKGLPELRQAVAADVALCHQRSGEMIDQSSRGRESGAALEQRIGVRTATLHSIVQNGADGLEKLLKKIAKWLGMSAEDIAIIKVLPNTVFAKPPLDGLTLKALIESKMLNGAVLSSRSIHDYLIRHNYTSLSFEEMKTQLEEEIEMMAHFREAYPNQKEVLIAKQSEADLKKIEAAPFGAKVLVTSESNPLGFDYAPDAADAVAAESKAKTDTAKAAITTANTPKTPAAAPAFPKKPVV